MIMEDTLMPNAEDKLEEALALLAAGIPLTEILADMNEDADWLRPLLEVAIQAETLQFAIPIPSPEASLQRMLAYGRELAAATPPAAPAQHGWFAMLISFLSTGWLPRLATGLVSALLLVVFLGGTLTVLAQRSLPGQPLYSLKRVVETLRLDFTFNPDQQTQLRESYNEQRQTETKLLLQENQVATVNFSGRLESVTETTLTLAGLTLQLTPQTNVNGMLAAGAKVEVQVQTQPPNTLMALSVIVLEPAPPTPTPLPTSTATPVPTLTPSPTTTATATQSLSSDTDTLNLPTLTPTTIPTVIPTSTPTLPPPPTATPVPPTATLPSSPLIPTPATPDQNENDGGDGNTNDNSNDDSGGDDNSGNDNSGGDNSGSGSDNSGSGSDDSGGDDNSGSGSNNSGSSSDDSGGDDHSGSGSDDSGGDDNSGSGDEN